MTIDVEVNSVGRTGGTGFDPRIIIAAVLAQQRASKEPKGIPLVSDEEAERRQRAADGSRRRRRLQPRLLLLVSPLLLAIALWAAFGSARPAVQASSGL